MKKERKPRTLTERSIAVKVGYKIMPATRDKITELSEEMKLSKSKVIELAIDKLGE